jgi:tRNA1(Val) A37 N6-methylase TrmN6
MFITVHIDIDDISYDSAVANVALNDLAERVRVVKAQSGDDARVLGPFVDKEFADTQ